MSRKLFCCAKCHREIPFNEFEDTWAGPVHKKCIDIGTFKPLSKAKLDRLIAKGREDAKELDEAIRSSFEMGDEANMRLR
jgi:hypothetical protein